MLTHHSCRPCVPEVKLDIAIPPRSFGLDILGDSSVRLRARSATRDKRARCNLAKYSDTTTRSPLPPPPPPPPSPHPPPGAVGSAFGTRAESASCRCSRRECERGTSRSLADVEFGIFARSERNSTGARTRSGFGLFRMRLRSASVPSVPCCGGIARPRDGKGPAYRASSLIDCHVSATALGRDRARGRGRERERERARARVSYSHSPRAHAYLAYTRRSAAGLLPLK